VSTIFTFCFGVVVGGFLTIIAIREAIPLRDHYMAILVSSIFAVFIVAALILWYFKVVKVCYKVLGEKGGGMINTILSFLLVSIVLLFLVVVGIFYAAIA
jgi:uncharacterized Tic20 family protein